MANSSDYFADLPMARDPPHRRRKVQVVFTSLHFAALLCAGPIQAAVKWTSAVELQHIWSKDNFERQVYARLASFQKVQRLAEYKVAKKTLLIDQQYRSFAKQFCSPKGFSWSPVKRASRNKVNNKVDTFECDLYIKCPSASQLTVSHVFRDCVDRLRAITTHANRSHWDQQTFGVLLAEVAQTPQSMRAKFWQLERALQFGPPELKSPTCCVVCINGDAALFEDAVHAARKSLFQATTCLSAVPVYAIWTEYRNTYAEIRAVKDELKELIAKSDRSEAAIKGSEAAIKELSAKSDRSEAAIKELSAKSDRSEAAIKELSAKSDRSEAAIKGSEAAIKELSAKSDRNEAAIKELSGKSDKLMEMMERIADRLGDPAGS